MQKIRPMICFLLTVCLIFGTLFVTGCGRLETDRYFEGAAEDYYNGLVAAGFPRSYAEALTELHLLHPSWQFVPLDVTATNSAYTWDYVIEQEAIEADRNLIGSDEKYGAYQYTIPAYQSANSEQATVAAISYFMDPRNFLNETDIFQFFDLSAKTSVSVSDVEAVLAGTFMQNAMLENGMTYAQYFYEVGTELGIYPVYLAVKAVQEQGTGGTSPLISGNCGTELVRLSGNAELLTLNGYYNFYNIGAYGDSTYEIYQNGMDYAKRGSSQMSAQWGGSGAWDTKWKSIYGGASFIKSQYVDRYQSTAYLQKFNVDGRSGRNFWGQYTQTVGDALSQSRILFQSLAARDRLDGAYTFLIPVYEGMPIRTRLDPAFGTCSYYARADVKYDFSADLTLPEEGEGARRVLYGSIKVDKGDKIEIKGEISHSYGVRGAEYSVDGGAWQIASSSEKLNFSLSADYAEGSTHILVIRGIADYDDADPAKKSNSRFLCAVLYVTVK